MSMHHSYSLLRIKQHQKWRLPSLSLKMVVGGRGKLVATDFERGVRNRDKEQELHGGRLTQTFDGHVGKAYKTQGIL